ncbi:MAG: hypothetical protein SF051_15705 [Elusimicrobiota bacterium]|nr:hypothetical protein [Elusimicrobiota bacterium]
MTRALLLSVLAVPAGAWDLGNGAGVEERRRELQMAWRSYNATMVDQDIVKRSFQEEEPDWVRDEKTKMTPPERPFGRLQGFVYRRDDVRFKMVGRHGPLKETAPKREAQAARLKALRAAEGAAVEELWAAMKKSGDEALTLESSLPARDAYATQSDSTSPARVIWYPLDFYRDQGERAEFYYLLYADKPRSAAGEFMPAVERRKRPARRFGR